jgi:Ca-activated chloride channel homolog
MTTTIDHPTACISDDDLKDLLESSKPARLEAPSGPLPLVEVSAETSIDGLIATTRYTQRFINPTTEHLEVSYIFPLPSRAGVTDFVATLGGRRIEGLLKERGAARADYEQAIAQSQRAALVEAERPDVFTAKIGNIAPKEEAVIELVVTGPLVVEDGEATFRFPLVTAPRFITGAPLGDDPAGTGLTPDTDAVPDASRLNPPLLSEDQPRPKLNFSVELSYPGLKAATLRTSHPMSVEEKAPEGTSKGVRSVVLTLAEGEKLDADLLVRFNLPKELTIHAIISDDQASKKDKKSPTGTKEKIGTWAITVVAPKHPTAIPRDVVFVMDRSGSMGGWKMVAARRAAARLVDSLLPEDRFALVAFDDRMDVFVPSAESRTPKDAPRISGAIELIAATDRNRFAATSWLAGCDARGGTEMRQPLVAAVELLGTTTADREPVVVLVTDGQIGAEAHLLASLELRLARTRFCVVGIDRVPNTSLLERLGRQSNGYTTFVESEDRLDEALQNLHRRIGRPDLLSVKVTAEGAELLDNEISPDRTVDVFSGVPCVVTGRYKRTGAKLPVLTITAEKADGSGTFTETVVAVKTPAKGITDTWARTRIADLEDGYDARRADLASLRAKIIEISIATHVLSRFTAFVAVDHETQEIASSHEMTQPVESPSGWAMSNTSLMAVNASSFASAGGTSLRSFASRSATNTSGDAGYGIGASTLLGGYSSSDSLVGASVPVRASVKRLNSLTTSKGSVQALLEACLDRLRKATDKRPAPVANLIRRLSRLQSKDPGVLSAQVALYGYMASTTSLADTIKAVEDALQMLSATTSQQPLDSGFGMTHSTFAASPPREFWS